MRRALTLLPLLAAACARGGPAEPPPRPGEPVTIVFRYQPLGGDGDALAALLRSFEREHPGVRVRGELVPSSSDLAHQLFLTALEGGGADLDVLVADVVWVPELARAGWIADLSAAFPADRLAADFVPGPLEAVVQDGRTWAVPWYVDVGLLYRRTDLVPEAPRTYEELRRAAAEAMRRQPGIAGYVWQGRQYEGLTCNAYEAIFGHGGGAVRGGRVLLDGPEAIAGLTYLRGLVEGGLSPETVTASAEEETRRVFQEGRAALMRNWPYAWAEANAPGSPIRGKVAFSALPTLDGSPGAGVLGGWQLAVRATAPPWKRAAAEQLVAHLTSHEANVVLALRHARNPARRSAYEDPRILAEAPFVAALLPHVERARARPVTPYYNLLADTLQSELSAAVTGIRPPEEALRRAQRHADRLTGAR